MATAENRTLSIEARLVDLITKPLSAIGKTLASFALAPLKGLGFLAKSFGEVRAQIGNLVLAYAGLKGLETIKEVLDQTAEFGKLALAMGDTVGNLSELRGAFAIAGQPLENFVESIKALQRAESQALHGNQQLADTFAELGLSLNDLRQLGPSEIFERIAQGLERFSTTQEKSLELAKLLPRAFLPLLPILTQGLDKFQAAVKDAKAVGSTITEGEFTAAEDLEQALVRLKLSLTALSRAVFEAFGPTVSLTLNNLAKLIANNREQVVALAKSLAVGLAKAVDIAAQAIIGLIRVIESIPGIKLVDEQQARELRKQLDLIEEIKSATSTKTVAEQGSTVRDVLGGFGVPGFDIGTKLASGNFAEDIIDAARANRAKITAELLPKEDEIRAKLAELEKNVKDGVAGTLDHLRLDIAASLGDAGQIIADSVVGQSGDVVAKASEDVDALSSHVDKLKKTIDGLEKPSVFTPTRAGKRLPLDDEPVLGHESERLAILKQLGGLHDNLIPIQRALEEIDRESEVLALRKAKDEGVINAQELAAAIDLVNEHFKHLHDLVSPNSDFFGGFNQGFEQATRQWTDFTKAGQEAAQTIISGGLDQLTQTLTDIVTGTKNAGEAFKAFARELLVQLTQIIIKLVIMKALEVALNLVAPGAGEAAGAAGGGIGDLGELSGFGFAKGGMLQNVTAFAGGGVARKPTLALFGEGRNAEAFVPLPDNRSIPVTLNGRGGGGETHVHFHVSAIDSRGVAQFLAENQDEIASAVADATSHGHPAMRAALQRASR
jgi:hypothetical protein